MTGVKAKSITLIQFNSISKSYTRTIEYSITNITVGKEITQSPSNVPYSVVDTAQIL